MGKSKLDATHEKAEGTHHERLDAGHAAGGRAVAGEPARVADYLAREMAETGSDYCVMRLAFGDMSRDEMRRSASLFAEKAMPALAKL